MKQYDAIIIGFGKGGKLLAAELAEPELESSHRGTFPSDVRRNMCKRRMYPYQSSDSRIGICGKKIL